MTNLISVIVPVYNVEKYVEKCVNSIINQSYRNLEIILVDDGSTDNSGKICDEFALKDNRIKVIHKENGGLSSSRNKALEIAKGEYIGFVDSDDYIAPNFYEELYKIIKNHDASISECDFLRIDIDNNKEYKEIIENINYKKNEKFEIYTNIEALRTLYGSRLKPYVKKVVVWNKLYKRKLFDNIRFPVGKLHEDEFTTYKILYKSLKIVSTNKALYGYIQTKNSIMRQEIKQKRINDNLEAYTNSSNFFKELKEIEIEMKSRRRYLEICIELIAKVASANSEDKDKKMKIISKLYKENYEQYIDKIKNNIKDLRENEIIKLLDIAYQDMKEDEILKEKHWNTLEKIINKE